MKWFKHDSNASLDAKLRRVRLKYGMEGYGFYWYLLELVAQNVDQHNLSFELEHDAEIIAVDTGINCELVQEIMQFMVKLGLFEQDNGILTCLKLARQTDEYTAKILRSIASVRTTSGECPEKVPPKRVEEKRTEEKRTEELPEELNLDAWKLYEKHRQEIRAKKLTPRGRLAAMKKMSTFPQDVQQRAVDLSIENGWQGLFPEKADEKTQRNSAESFDTKLARLNKKAGLE